MGLVVRHCMFVIGSRNDREIEQRLALVFTVMFTSLRSEVLLRVRTAVIVAMPSPKRLCIRGCIAS